MTLAARHETFQRLHQSGCFVIPNPWDAGSAQMMAALGARALATSSAAHAFTLGKTDGAATRDETLAHCADLLRAVDLPIYGDFVNGFGDSPDEVAETVRLGAEIGLSGLSIEDTRPLPGHPVYDFDLAVERIRAGVAAARALGRPFVFCARADGVIAGVYDVAEGIRRLKAFEKAGADLLYLPLLPDVAALKAVLAAVTQPVNVLSAGAMARLTVAEIGALGVRRISTGSSIARLTHAAIRDSVRAMLDDGSFAPLAGAAATPDIDSLIVAGRAGNAG